MKIGNFHVGFFKEKTIKPIDTTELGGSGTEVFDGVVSGIEYNSKLNTEYGGVGLSTYDEMRKSDPIVKQSLNIITMPIIQAHWVVESPDNEPQAEAITEFVKEALFQRMDRSWQDIVREFLTYLPFGFSVFEKVYMVEDGKVWLKKLGMRTQKSIVKFETEDKNFGITQQLNDSRTSKQASIPAEKLLIFTNEREGDNYRGVSVLRSAYKPYYYKDLFEKIDAISYERSGVGLPVFKMPQNPKPKDVTNAENIGEALRANEKAFVLLPDGWEFDIKKSDTQSDAVDRIKLKNREILSNVLAQFLDLGSGSTGSRSLSEDHSEAFFKATQAHADYISNIINDYLIEQLVDYNFNNVKNYPTIKATGIKKTDLSSLSTALKSLADGGLLTVDTELEEFIRATFGLPNMPEDVKEDEAEKKKQEKPEDKKEVPGNSNPGDNNEEDEDEVEKSFTEHTSCGCKHFSDKETTDFKPFRALTFAEEKIDFDRLHKILEELQIRFGDELLELVESELSVLLARIRVALRTKNVMVIDELFNQFKFEISDLVMSQQQEAFEFGKRSASRDLKVTPPATTDEQLNLMKTRSSAIADDLATTVKNNVKLQAVQHLTQDTNPADAVESIRKNVGKTINTKTDATASANLMGGFNQGRLATYEANKDKIYALQRSELLDKKICNYCLSIDSRVITPDDPMAKIDQFHFYCRGIWVEILEDEAEKPDITGIPDNLKSRVGTLNDFKQISSPEPLEGSPTEAFVKARGVK